jgi:XRE family transcriptional regulator, regulator of sulfur utilization
LSISEPTALHRLANRIKELRDVNGWSQEVLAERASIQRSYVADLERGSRNPSVRTLVKLANAFRVDLPDLFEE